MSPMRLSALVLLVLSMAGCPSSPPAGGDAQVLPPPMPPDAVPGLSFARSIRSGAPTVTLHIVVEGLTRGQIDFTTFDGDGKNGRAHSVHVQRFESSTFDVVAPANFERKLVVSAVPVEGDELQADDGAAVSANGEVVIGSEDQTLTLSKPIL